MWLALLRLLRPKQYSKNVFVFAALLFTRGYEQAELVRLTLGAFLAMCLLGSATYVANDIIDLERDRAHPKKRSRPLPSGLVSVTIAWVISAIFLIAGLAVAWSVRRSVFECGLIYLSLQVLYNLWLKHVPIADVFIIATGFVLRVVVGSVAIHAPLSGWILLCTASLALLLGFGKRRHEFLIQGEDRHKSRESLAGYTLAALDAFVIASGAGAAMCYGIYSIESATARQYPALILTTPFVAYGICRYLVLIFGSEEAGEPESLVIKDIHIIVAVVLFTLIALYALTGVRLSFLSH